MNTAYDDHGRLDVRYVRLTFKIGFLEDTELPMNKVSALRGGLGEMLLRQNCIRLRKCADCDFESECIVRRTMYSQYDIQPEFATGNDSIGYVLECENYDEMFSEGSTLFFYLILFGKTIVYLNQYLQAFYALGQEGIGKRHSRYNILGVYNEWKDPVVQGTMVYKDNYRVSTLKQYVQGRMDKVRATDQVVLHFQTATSIKYRGNFIEEFIPEAVIESIVRRIYMLDCFEGKDIPEMNRNQYMMPELLEQKSRHIYVNRYSSTAQKKMVLNGIRGWMKIRGVSEELLQIILASEIMHCGKNTSFGFGRIYVEGENENE